MKRRMTYQVLMTVAVAVAGLLPLHAQYVTYNHDESVMNQFTVGETGLGHLTPDLYYDALHKSYRNSAMLTNKQLFRLQLKTMSLSKEEKHAETIDSMLTDRVNVEWKNIADRTPGMLDVTYMVEKSKIESKLAMFRANIEKITLLGGTSAQYRQWLEVYNAVNCGLQAVRDAYMPQGNRKEQYLAIYKDILQKNVEVCEVLECLRDMRDIKKLKDAGLVYPRSDFSRIAIIAKGRWKYALAAGSGTSASISQETADDRLDRLKDE